MDCAANGADDEEGEGLSEGLRAPRQNRRAAADQCEKLSVSGTPLITLATSSVVVSVSKPYRIITNVSSAGAAAGEDLEEDQP